MPTSMPTPNSKQLAAKSQMTYALDEVSCGRDRLLRLVPTLGIRPDCHDGIADKLVDDAAMALEHFHAEIQVGAQLRGHLCGRHGGGQASEVPDVGEQDGRIDEARAPVDPARHQLG